MNGNMQFLIFPGAKASRQNDGYTGCQTGKETHDHVGYYGRTGYGSQSRLADILTYDGAVDAVIQILEQISQKNRY